MGDEGHDPVLAREDSHEADFRPGKRQRTFIARQVRPCCQLIFSAVVLIFSQGMRSMSGQEDEMRRGHALQSLQDSRNRVYLRGTQTDQVSPVCL